jgi:hypothetical protein
MQGQSVSAEDVQELAKLPPIDVLRGQVLGAVAAPLYAIVGLFSAPLRDLHGLIQARIDQLDGESAEAPATPDATNEGSAAEDDESPATEAAGEEDDQPADSASAQSEQKEE